MSGFVFCINCQHCKLAGHVFVCERPQPMRLDLVTGKQHEETPKGCTFERSAHGGCGVEGRYFAINPVQRAG